MMGTMLQRRRLLAPAAALLLMATAAHVVSADDFCENDPTLPIKTPGGNTVVIHVTSYALGTQHLDALRSENVSYIASSAAVGSATNVSVTVLIPDDQYGNGFPVRAVASSGPSANPGAVFDDESGKSGKELQLSFQLPVS